MYFNRLNIHCTLFATATSVVVVVTTLPFLFFVQHFFVVVWCEILNIFVFVFCWSSIREFVTFLFQFSPLPRTHTFFSLCLPFLASAIQIHTNCECAIRIQVNFKRKHAQIEEAWHVAGIFTTRTNLCQMECSAWSSFCLRVCKCAASHFRLWFSIRHFQGSYALLIYCLMLLLLTFFFIRIRWSSWKHIQRFFLYMN